MLSPVDPRNNVLHWGPNHIGRWNFEGREGMPQRHSTVSCAISIRFGLWTHVYPRMHVLHGGPDPHAKGKFLRERTCPVMLDDTAVSHAKTAESIEMPFRLWARVGLRNHVLDGGPDPKMRKSNF